MRRFLAVTASVIALLGVLVPTADAQAPAPKVTITGLVDQVSSWQRNMSLYDTDLSRDKDHDWYSRTRMRPDITAEIGTTKFVLGLEMDIGWGQSCGGSADNNIRCVTDAWGAPNGARYGHRNALSGGYDLNTDVGPAIELKWGYTEFDLPGAPAGSRVRLGAQPFAITHKLATLATGDFAGAHLTVALTPAIKFNLTYAQMEEVATGFRDGFWRGEDFALFTSIDISPFKGLDVRPIYSFAQLRGPTSSSTRQGRGGLSGAQSNFIVNGSTGFTTAATSTATSTTSQVTPTFGGVGGTAEEYRHTLGVDLKWSAGPFFVDPTVFYQWGTREHVGAGAFAGALREQDMNAWLFDVRGGWRAGPLLVEGAAVYTTGNKATEDIRDPSKDVNFYQPISTDGVFYAGWSEILAPGIDYFNTMLGHDSQRGLNPGFAIGYDKYGLIRLGARASYALTPAFTVRGGLNANWTAEKVDTDGTRTAAAGVTPSGTDPDGEDRYLGTEVYAGITWRFAPGLTFDLAGGYLFIGDAYKAASTSTTAAIPSPTLDVTRASGDPKDVKTIAARVRYSF